MKVLLRTGRILPLMLAMLVSLLGLVGEGMGVAYAATQTVMVCDQTHLNNALTAASPGDTINFSCSGDITLTSTLVISKNNLTLDGSGQSVTLDGQHSVPILFVNSVMFTLNALTIANGSGTGNNFGGLGNLGGTVKVTNSTFHDNSDTNFGGGLNNDGTTTIINSTFTSNSAHGLGGGGLGNSGGTMTIINSTIADNSAPQGGGLNNQNGTIKIAQSIVANNTAPSGANCSGTITNQGYNLSNDTSCFMNGVNNSIVTSNPQLAASLANNGGPTPTLVLLPGSPAIDQIPASLCPSTDQRGFPRPDNGESVCDIGAFEFQDPPTPPAPTCQISTTKPGTFCLNQNGNFTTTDIS